MERWSRGKEGWNGKQQKKKGEDEGKRKKEQEEASGSVRHETAERNDASVLCRESDRIRQPVSVQDILCRTGVKEKEQDTQKSRKGIDRRGSKKVVGEIR